MPDEDFDQVLADAAAMPKKGTGDNGSAEQHSLPDLMAYDRYRAGKNRRGSGIKVAKIVPGGAAP